MEINLVNNPVQIPQNLQAVLQQNVIDVKDIKSILYLGIKGNIFIPVDEKHTVDTYA
jgi:hypothetical protein